MQIGQTIWAIDPCKQILDDTCALTVGKAYEVKDISNISFKILNDFGESRNEHWFPQSAFSKYFSLTPTEGKGGEDLILEAKGANVTVRGKMDKENELAIETKYGKVFLTSEQVTQLRDHLTEVLNKE